MALLKNHKGEYNYQFLWMEEDGNVCGFNDVWAANKREAVKKAKAMENPAGWRMFDEERREYVRIDKPANNINGKCYYNKGMYLKPDSMYRATAKQRDDMDRLSWMMTC